MYGIVNGFSFDSRIARFLFDTAAKAEKFDHIWPENKAKIFDFPDFLS